MNSDMDFFIEKERDPFDPVISFRGELRESDLMRLGAVGEAIEATSKKSPSDILLTLAIIYAFGGDRGGSI